MWNGVCIVLGEPTNRIMRHILFCLFLLPISTFSQKVYSVQYPNQSDVKVFVVEYESQCDLKVYKVDYPNQVNGNTQEAS